MKKTTLMYLSKSIADPGRLLLRLKKQNISAEIKIKDLHPDRGYPATCLVKVNLENKTPDQVNAIKKAIYSNNF